MQHEMSIAPCLQLATKISYWCDAAVIVSTDECWRMSNNLIHWKFMSIVQRITAYKCSTLGSRVIRRGRAKRRQMQSTTTCVFVSPTRFYCTVFKDTFDMSRLPASIRWLWIEQHVAAVAKLLDAARRHSIISTSSWVLAYLCIFASYVAICAVINQSSRQLEVCTCIAVNIMAVASALWL